jgi:cytochrome oxidase Cu insertion factor (SCO1/SenC/PrrC family)
MTSRLVLFLALCGAAGCGARSNPTDAKKEADPDPRWPVGEFSLTERSGKTVTDRDLRGTVWVASFIFTECSGPCPVVTSNMGRLQSELADELKSGKVKLVSFTVDPERDTPEKLRQYADARKADAQNWLFLTGDEKQIHRLLRENLKQGIGRNPNEDVKPGEEFIHSTRLVVVDQEGKVRGFYDGVPSPNSPTAEADFDANLARLKARVRTLLK